MNVIRRTTGKASIALLTCIILIFNTVDTSAQPGNPGNWHGPQTLQQLAAAPVALIPFPQQAEWNHEKFILKQDITIAWYAPDAGIVKNSLRSLNELLTDNGIKTNFSELYARNPVLRNEIRLIVDRSIQIKDEGYYLKIDPGVVIIKAKDAAGLYYGVQTLRQLLCREGKSVYLHGCIITDWPAFGLRGFMHDTGRNFQGIGMLKAQLDILSHYKYNTFHWHLTDNPAWRTQRNVYPQLNKAENRKPGRDPDSTYSFDDIRELIRYARDRNITVIPELDMPGHSKYFEPAFGFKMESEQGMQVLEKLIDEFCIEISAADCPIIHIGSDEVHIPDPDGFIKRITRRVEANGRKVMVWNPGLPPEPGTIEQLWRDEGTESKRKSNNPFVDSYAGYLNSYDALYLIQRYFFQQVCNRPQGDSVALGGILCCWPDTRVDDKLKIPLYNPVWPGALAYSEAVWCGRPCFVPEFMKTLPAKGTLPAKYFQEFENRLCRHRDKSFNDEYFPYVKFGNIEWLLSGPFYRSKDDAVSKEFAPEKAEDTGNSTGSLVITGGIIRFDGWFGPETLSKDACETVYLTGYIKSKKEQTINAIIGFEAPVRSNRRSAGIPENGKWDANGGAVFVNGNELQGPQWGNPGGNRYLQPTWETPANEIPYTDEEFYWSRPPAPVHLKKGWNKIVVRVPRTYNDQAWMFAFVPVRFCNGRWIEDASLEVKASRIR